MEFFIVRWKEFFKKRYLDDIFIKVDFNGKQRLKRIFNMLILRLNIFLTV